MSSLAVPVVKALVIQLSPALLTYFHSMAARIVLAQMEMAHNTIASVRILGNICRAAIVVGAVADSCGLSNLDANAGSD
jgi:hypothetical protein